MSFYVTNQLIVSRRLYKAYKSPNISEFVPGLQVDDLFEKDRIVISIICHHSVGHDGTQYC